MKTIHELDREIIATQDKLIKNLEQENARLKKLCEDMLETLKVKPPQVPVYVPIIMPAPRCF